MIIIFSEEGWKSDATQSCPFGDWILDWKFSYVEVLSPTIKPHNYFHHSCNCDNNMFMAFCVHFRLFLKSQTTLHVEK